MSKAVLILLLSLLALSAVSFAQQTSEPLAWEVTLASGTTARSTLTVVNRCKKSHTFEIALENISFMSFPASNQVKVSGGKSVALPVRFDTAGLVPGVYTGTVVVVCKSCTSEPTCTQDRERLPVKLTVTGSAVREPTTITTGTPTIPETGKTKTPCELAERNCEELRLKTWQMESQAASARSLAQQARQTANELEGVAAAAEQKARDLIAASKDSEGELGRSTDTERGRVYTGRDFKLRREHEEKIWADFRAARINGEEAYRRLQEFQGLEGLDKFQDTERKRLSELKYQAEQAAKEAEQTRAAAHAADAQAKAAEETTKRAEEEAKKARAAYEECVKRIPSDCPRLGGISGAMSSTPRATQTPTGAGPTPPGAVTDASERQKGPCEQDCNELLQAAQDKEAEAAKAQAMADAARNQAEGLERVAREAEEAARKAAEAAKDPTSRGRIIDHDRGRVYTGRDFELQREANRSAFNDYKAGKINAEELQQQWNDNSGLEALDRLQDADQRQRSQKKFEAEQLAKKAAEARAAADSANAIARAAQEAANQATAEAKAAFKLYEDCVRKLKEECEKERIDRAKAVAAQQAAAATANQAAVQAANAARAAAAQKIMQAETVARRKKDNEYLVDNIRKLNLISYRGFTEIPGLWDWLPTYLESPVGNLVEEAGRSQIPTDVLKAIGGLYSIVNAMRDPCVALGGRTTVLKLTRMVNPSTGNNYSLEEALNKNEAMCRILRQLKAKVEAQNRLNR